MREALVKDYNAMTGMVFGDVPHVGNVFESVERLEKAMNSTPI